MIRQIFNYDSPVMRTLENITNVWLLHFAMLITSIPVVTMGTSFMAGNAVMTRIYDNRETHVLRDYWQYFKENIKQGTKLTLLLAVVFAILSLDMLYLNRLPVTVRLTVGNIIAILIAVSSLMGTVLPAYLSRYDESIRHAARNIVIIVLHHFPSAILMVVVAAFPLVLLMAGDVGVWSLILWMTFFGFGVCIWLQSAVFARIITKVEHSIQTIAG